jgi:hypothetical protein
MLLNGRDDALLAVSRSLHSQARETASVEKIAQFELAKSMRSR